MTNEEIVKELKEIKQNLLKQGSYSCVIMAGITNLITHLSPPKPKFKVGDLAVTVDGWIGRVFSVDSDSIRLESVRDNSFNRSYIMERKINTLTSIEEFITKFGDK